MTRRNFLRVCVLSSYLWLRLLKVVVALVCSDIPPAERVDCEPFGADENLCLNDGCCFENNGNSNVPKCFYRADRRKIHFASTTFSDEHFALRFDNKQYFVINSFVSRQELDDRCAQFGPGYRPAYINYKDEYIMLRLAVRPWYGVRGPTDWLEVWLGGSSPGTSSPHYSRNDNKYPRCPVLAYHSYKGPGAGKTVVRLGQDCSHEYVRGMCERFIDFNKFVSDLKKSNACHFQRKKNRIFLGTLNLGMPVIEDGCEVDADGCKVFKAVSNVREIRFAQTVTISGTRGEFTLEIPTKGNSTCDKMVFGITGFSSTCNSEYMRGSDHCERLETLPDEDSCYVRCSSGGSDPVNGTLMVIAGIDETEWALCPMRLA